MSQKTLKIKEFNINDIPFNSKITAIGKPATGKSTLIADLIAANAYRSPVCKVICGTLESNEFYRETFPDLYMDDEYTEEAMEDFAKRQKLAKRTNEGIEYGANAIICLDDCSDDPKYFNRPLFQKFYKNGRHWNMMLIFALQYGLDIRPVIRTNVDYVFIFREPIETNRKNIYKNYGSIVGTYKEFCDVLDQITEDHTALVLSNRVQSNKVEDCVFYYKANQHDNVEFGCTEYKQWAKQRYDENYVSNIF